MLFGVSWIMSLNYPLFSLFDFTFTGKTLMLIGGGGFLIIKSMLELKEMFVTPKHRLNVSEKEAKYWKAIMQIVFIDLVLSFDSIITAVGIAGNNLTIIIIAIVVAMIIMLFASKPIGDFIAKYQSLKVIALAFILLVGIFLVAGGLGIDIPKAYLYFAMFFSLGIESINILLQRQKSKA
jgi:predicted tellurium resistance membrane protein TerC